MKHEHPSAFFAVLLAFASGCDGQDSTVTSGADPTEPDPGGGDPSSSTPSDNDGPLYVVSTNVFAPDGIIGYVALVPSLDASVTLDLTRALEFPGGANAVGIDGEPYVYVALWSTPEVERWDLQPDGSFARGPRISFANLGVLDSSSLAFSPIVARDKSYFADYIGSQLVTWSPAAMQALGTIPLPLETEGGLAPVLMSYLTIQPGTVLVNSFMNDPDDSTRYSDRSRLFAIDTASDRIVNVDEAIGCEKLQLAGQTSDGTAYYTADNSRVFVRYALGPGRGAAACGMRVVPPGRGFEQGYNVDLTTLVGGRPVVGDLAVVSDDMAFLRVWHEEDADEVVTPENFQDVYAGSRAFRWWSWRLGASEAHEVPDQTPHSSFTDRFQVEGRTFVVDNTFIDENGGRGDAPLIELTPDGTLRRALTAKGQLGGTIFRIR